MTSSSNDTDGVIAHPLLALVADGYIQIDHSWRCEHPDVYGPCSCEREAAESFDARLAAHDAELTERVRAEQIQADAQIVESVASGYWTRKAAAAIREAGKQ